MRVNWPQPGRRWHRNVSCVTGGIRGAATFPLRRSSVAAPGEYQATEAKNTYVSHTYVYIYIDCFFSLRSTWYEWKSLICKYIVIILTFCATDLPRALRKLGDFHSMEVLLGCYFWPWFFHRASYIPHFLHDLVFFLIQLCTEWHVVVFFNWLFLEVLEFILWLFLSRDVVFYFAGPGDFCQLDVFSVCFSR